MDFYLQGLALGLAYVAPIGMQNLFVINSALTQTRLRALVTALIVIFLMLRWHWHAFSVLALLCKNTRRCSLAYCCWAGWW